MHYTGTIAKDSPAGDQGAEFDSSRGRGNPFQFTLGHGMVIKGWDLGLTGMCVGEKRELTIPAEIGYGDTGAGAKIPGGATLHFDVELMDISDAPAPPNIFADIDADADGSLSVDELKGWFKREHNRDLPDDLLKSEDKDGDGVVSWEEFSGPKGAPKDEL